MKYTKNIYNFQCVVLKLHIQCAVLRTYYACPVSIKYVVVASLILTKLQKI